MKEQFATFRSRTIFWSIEGRFNSHGNKRLLQKIVFAYNGIKPLTFVSKFGRLISMTTPPVNSRILGPKSIKAWRLMRAKRRGSEKVM